MSTDDTATTTNPQPPPAGDADQGDVDVADQVDIEGDGGDREAAKYRRRLRETESDRDRLASVVEGYQRREVEAAAGGLLAAGSDLWAAGVQLPDLLGDDGQVDAGKVEAAAQAAIAAHPHWRVSHPSMDGGVRTSVDSGKSWSQLIGGKG